MFPRVSGVRHLNDYELEIRFTDGRTFRTSRGQYLANFSGSSRESARVVFGGHIQQLEDFAMQRGEFGCQVLGGFGSGCR